jgi:hypothetical protein
VAIGQNQRSGPSIYQPLESHKGLFRTFAGTEISKKGILAFANQYGPLGGCKDSIEVSPQKRIDPGHIFGFGEWAHAERRVRATGNPPGFIGLGGTPVKTGTRAVVYGEPFAKWASEISSMHEMLWLWEALQHKQISLLRQVIKWDGSVGVYYEPEHSPQRKGSVYPSRGLWKEWILGLDNPELRHVVESGDVLTPGWYYLQRIMNQKMSRNRSFSALLWDRENSLRLTIMPANLISALWLQFARAVDRDRSYRACEHCRRWIEVGADSRADAKYCSNSCRQKAYRHRRTSDSV